MQGPQPQREPALPGPAQPRPRRAPRSRAGPAGVSQGRGARGSRAGAAPAPAPQGGPGRSAGGAAQGDDVSGGRAAMV